MTEEWGSIDEIENPANDIEAHEPFSDEKSIAASRPGSSWSDLAAQQRADAETAQINANQKMFDGFVNIETAARRKAVALDNQKAIAGAAMMESAFRNGGMSDRSLSPAFSQAFGMPVYGGQIIDLNDGGEKAFVIYGATKDPRTGEARVAPVAMMDGTQMMRVLQRAKLGDRTEDLQKSIYGGLSSRYTPDQLAKMGLRSPTAPISTGTTVISGASLRSMRGEPRQRSTISVFSNVGGDGRIGSGTRSATIRPDGTREEVTTGTRREDAPGKWKVLSSGADGTRYENDKTGEVVNVPKGSSLRDILRNGGSERERIAQMNNDSREKRAQVTADATKYKADMAKEIAEIRTRQQTGRAGRDATANDAKRLAEIVGDYKLDEATRNAAKEALDKTLASLGTSPAPAKGGEKKDKGVGKTSGFRKLLPDEYKALSPEEKKRYHEEYRKAKAAEKGKMQTARSEQEIVDDPRDGEKVPLKDGGYAVFNAKTDMWERA